MQPHALSAQLQSSLTETESKLLTRQRECCTANSKLHEDLAHEMNTLRNRKRQLNDALAACRLRQTQSWKNEDFKAGIIFIFDELGRNLDRWFMPR